MNLLRSENLLVIPADKLDDLAENLGWIASAAALCADRRPAQLAVALSRGKNLYVAQGTKYAQVRRGWLVTVVSATRPLRIDGNLFWERLAGWQAVDVKTTNVNSFVRFGQITEERVSITTANPLADVLAEMAQDNWDLSAYEKAVYEFYWALLSTDTLPRNLVVSSTPRQYTSHIFVSDAEIGKWLSNNTPVGSVVTSRSSFKHKLLRVSYTEARPDTWEEDTGAKLGDIIGAKRIWVAASKQSKRKHNRHPLTLGSNNAVVSPIILLTEEEVRESLDGRAKLPFMTLKNAETDNARLCVCTAMKDKLVQVQVVSSYRMWKSLIPTETMGNLGWLARNGRYLNVINPQEVAVDINYLKVEMKENNELELGPTEMPEENTQAPQVTASEMPGTPAEKEQSADADWFCTQQAEAYADALISDVFGTDPEPEHIPVSDSLPNIEQNADTENTDEPESTIPPLNASEDAMDLLREDAMDLLRDDEILDHAEKCLAVRKDRLAKKAAKKAQKTELAAALTSWGELMAFETEDQTVAQSLEFLTDISPTVENYGTGQVKFVFNFHI